MFLIFPSFDLIQKHFHSPIKFHIYLPNHNPIFVCLFELAMWSMVLYMANALQVSFPLTIFSFFTISLALLNLKSYHTLTYYSISDYTTTQIMLLNDWNLTVAVKKLSTSHITLCIYSINMHQYDRKNKTSAYTEDVQGKIVRAQSKYKNYPTATNWEKFILTRNHWYKIFGDAQRR